MIEQATAAPGEKRDVEVVRDWQGRIPRCNYERWVSFYGRPAIVQRCSKPAGHDGDHVE